MHVYANELEAASLLSVQSRPRACPFVQRSPVVCHPSLGSQITGMHLMKIVNFSFTRMADTGSDGTWSPDDIHAFHLILTQGLARSAKYYLLFYNK
jgi:hypothetical protein